MQGNPMKVAILTFYYRIYNYGALLQSYALAKAVSLLGADCQQITYVRDRKGLFLRKLRRILQVPSRQRKVFFRAQLRRISRKFFKKKPSPFMVATKKAFNRFAEDIPHTPVVDRESIKTLVPDFDVFIVGSDQVWNPEFVSMRYFFDFLPDGKKRASYAASIRIPRFEKKEGAVIKALVDKFDCVSVREKTGVGILQDIGVSKEIHVVLDPTMLLPPESWQEMLKEPEIRERYVFSYLIREASVRKQIEEIARARGCKIVEIASPDAYSGPRGDLYVDLDFVGPREFVGLIKNAECVFPDSFHGTALAVVFEKNFAVISGDETDDRKTTLLASLGLRDRVIPPDGDLAAVVARPIDYRAVKEKLGVLQESSWNVLREIVSQK